VKDDNMLAEGTTEKKTGDGLANTLQKNNLSNRQ
jgi:hypothetical protein